MAAVVLVDDLASFQGLQKGHTAQDLEDGLLVNTTHSFKVETSSQGPTLHYETLCISK